MADKAGNKSGMAGNVVALSGDADIRQASTTIDALTITLASGAGSTAAARGLNVRRWVQEGGSGTSIMTTEYDGLRFLRSVIELSTASSAASLTADQSGAFVVVGAMSSGMTITLPAVAQGLWYDIYVGGTPASGGITIAAASTGTMVAFNDTAADKITMGVSSALAIGGNVRVVAGSAKWYVITNPAFSSVSPTSNAGMTHFDIGT